MSVIDDPQSYCPWCKREHDAPEFMHSTETINKQAAEIERLTVENVYKNDALAFAELALNDWVTTYASDLCDPDDLVRALSRISNRGGTLAYIGEVLEEVRAAMRE